MKNFVRKVLYFLTQGNSPRKDSSNNSEITTETEKFYLPESEIFFSDVTTYRVKPVILTLGYDINLTVKDINEIGLHSKYGKIGIFSVTSIAGKIYFDQNAEDHQDFATLNHIERRMTPMTDAPETIYLREQELENVQNSKSNQTMYCGTRKVNPGDVEYIRADSAGLNANSGLSESTKNEQPQAAICGGKKGSLTAKKATYLANLEKILALVTVCQEYKPENYDLLDELRDIVVDLIENTAN